MCHSWCRHLSALNKKGLPAATKGKIVLNTQYTAGTLPPQYDHAVREKYASSGTALK